MTVNLCGASLRWLGYACARVESPDGTVIYTDPGRYGTLTGAWAEEYGGVAHPSGPATEPTDGDLVLVTHDHHYDADGVQRVAAEDATVLVYEALDTDRIADHRGDEMASPEDLPYDVRRVSYGDHLTLAGVDVDVVPAYNREDGPRTDSDGQPFHPRGFGCGFQFAVADRTYFWPGDSDVVSEHEDCQADVLLPSIARSFTMDRHDAASLAQQLKPELVLPIHYNTFEGLRADSQAFAADVASRGVPVVLDEGWS